MSDSPSSSSALSSMRLDKWLWAARFFKTRSLASQEITKGRVQVNGQVAKPSRDVKPGDVLDIRQGPLTRSITVRQLSAQRGPAPVAQALYEETAESLARREEMARRHRESPEPSLAIEQGRPTKRDRRQLADWNRWSAKAESQ